MVMIKIDRKEFEKHAEKIEKIREKINLFGIHVENITENEIELEILPNRPDLMSLQGFLRSFRIFIGKEKLESLLKKYKIEKPKKNFVVDIDNSVKDVRPYTACAIVKGIRFDDAKIKEIIDVQEKLHTTIGRDRKKAAIGIYPLEKIILPIKYKAVEPEKIRFIPLEFNKELNAKEILQLHPTGIKYSHLLHGKKRFPVFVDSKNQIMSMPPIINSELTGKIIEKTRDVFIECSGFDLELLKKILSILVLILIDMGGKAYAMNLRYGNKYKEKSIIKKSIITPDLSLREMKISLSNVNKLLGLKLKKDEVEKLLRKMGYSFTKKNSNMHKQKTNEQKTKDVFYVKIPPWRTDIMHEVDVIEDVAIAYGYDKFIPELPEISTIAEEDKEETIKRKIAEVLIGLNMQELSTYHLLTQKDLEIFKLKNVIEIEESKTEYKYLRPNLLISTLKVLSRNVDVEYPQKIFEIGKVFLDDKEMKSETGVKEKNVLAIALAPGNFTETKQILEYIARMIDIKIEIVEYDEVNEKNKEKYKEKNEGKNRGKNKEDKKDKEELEEIKKLAAFFVGGRIGKIMINKKTCGIVGEIHPALLKALGIRMPVSGMQLDLDLILDYLTNLTIL